MATEASVVDLRSDTLTTPDPEMRRAMAEAVVGDDVWGEDPSVQALQRETALLLGKEAALFVPSGTMANLIAIMNHCWGRGFELVAGDQSHIILYEQGGAAQIAGVHTASLPNLPNGTFDLSKLRSCVKPDDPHKPITKLVCIENTHNIMGGKVLPMTWLDELGAICKEFGLAVHLDGARLLNAAVRLGVPPASLTRHCDSVSLCLSKGLGAPVGSLLAGSSDFIKRAVRIRKSLGGGMRQAGVLAAAGQLALARYETTLARDHQNALAIAKAVNECGSRSVTVDAAGVHSNIVMLDCDTARVSSKLLQQRLEESTRPEDTSVRGFALNAHQVRLVTHTSLAEDAVEKACRKIVSVISALDQHAS